MKTQVVIVVEDGKIKSVTTHNRTPFAYRLFTIDKSKVNYSDHMAERSKITVRKRTVALKMFSLDGGKIR